MIANTPGATRIGKEVFFQITDRAANATLDGEPDALKGARSVGIPFPNLSVLLLPDQTG
jgi:hypothetical protein